MGNILSQDDIGSLKGNGESLNPFTQNMTNLLFELDLYNTGKYATDASAGDNGPRPEFDYTETGVSKDRNSKDVKNFGRPVNNNNQFIDINGWTYTDNSATPQIDTISAIKTVVNNPESSISKNTNKLYNLKRAFCNNAVAAPVNMVGVDLPADSFRSINLDLKKDQEKLGIPNNETINNCLLYGTTTAGTLPSDADNRLNFKSDYKLNDFSTNTVYDTPMNDTCKKAMNAMLINSFVAPRVADYSNWPDKASANNITQNPIAQMALLHNPVTNAVAVKPRSDKRVLLKADGTEDTNFYRFEMTTPDDPANTTTAVKVDQNESCSNLSIDLCDLFYYYDVKDGILFNPSFNSGGADPAYYANNIRYLNQHIPECRCLSLDKLSNDTSAPNSLLNFYQNEKNICDTNMNYGKRRDNLSEDVYIYNQNSTSLSPDAVGFRRQKDPSTGDVTGVNNTTDNKFLFANNVSRSANLRNYVGVINNYTCNMSMNIRISDIAGNALVGGNTMTCNFAGAGAPGPPGGAGESGATGPAVSTITVTSIRNVRGPIEVNSKPLNAGEPFNLGVSYPSTDTTTIQNFYNLVSIAFYPINGGEPIILSKQFVKCTNPQNNNSQNVCNPPYVITTPFIYGPVMDYSGVKFLVKLTKNPSSNSQFLTTNGLPISIVQYSMRISSTNLRKVEGKNLLSIGINLNTLPGTNFTLPCRVLLTPVTGNSPPTNCSASTSATGATGATTPTNVCLPVQIVEIYPDLFDALSKNPYLVIGNNRSICPIKYYYSIKLNETNNGTSYTGGYDMLYDPQMPLSQQCVVDFSNLVSSFNQFQLMYYDYDNNNSINVVANNDTIKLGSSMMLSWAYNSVDSTENVIDIYYDTVETYNANSSSKVLLTSKYPGGYPLTRTSSESGLSTNSYLFIYPILPTQTPVIFYGVIRGSSKVSPIIKTSNTQLPTNFRNWNIVSGFVTDASVIEPTSNIVSIDNYFSATKTITTIPSSNDQWGLPLTTTVIPPLGSSAISFGVRPEPFLGSPNPLGGSSNFWGSANLLPTSTTVTVPCKYIYSNSGIWYGGTILSESNSSDSSNIIFQNPITYNPPLPKITITSIIDTTSGREITIPSSVPLSVELGANIIVKYTINPAVTYDTNMQIMLGDKKVLSFIVNRGVSSGQNIIPIFANSNSLTSTLYITSYNTLSELPDIRYASPSVSIQINSSSATSIQISNTETPTVTAKNQINPVLNISSSSANGIVDLIDLSYGTFISNNYYTSFNGFKKELSIKKVTIDVGIIDFALPFTYTFAVAPPSSSSFTNVTQKLNVRKNVENFSNINPVGELYIDLLQYDFSKATLTPQININLFFERYKRVNIQNLELNFGDNILDGKKLGIQSDGYIDGPAQILNNIDISKITIIGRLTTNIFLSKPLNKNAPDVIADMYYSTATKVNGNYAYIVSLIYSNGYYSVPETYASAVAAIIAKDNETKSNTASKLALNTKIVPAPVPEEQNSNLYTGLIIALVLVIIAAIIYIYLKYIAPSSPSPNGLENASPVSDSPDGSENVSPESPASDSPATDSPATDSPATDSPAPDSPATDSPAPDSPAPDSPAPDSPAPDSPGTDSPETVSDSPAPSSESNV